MEKKTVGIPSISCGHCVASIRREILAIEGVVSVEGDPAKKQVTIAWGPPATWEAIAGALAEIGFSPE